MLTEEQIQKLVIWALDKVELMSHVNFEKLDSPPLNFDLKEFASGTAERWANLDIPFYKEELSSNGLKPR